MFTIFLEKAVTINKIQDIPNFQSLFKKEKKKKDDEDSEEETKVSYQSEILMKIIHMPGKDDQ